ncbi:MAG: xylulokinase [Oscillospiraceae bacterium]|nr:xylulokinase [Oscillospiraceae bacterium]
MPEKDYILGIDIGTSACKAAVFDKNGNVIISETGAYNIYYPKDGYVEQKPGEWWAVVCKSIKNIFASGKVSPEDIKAVGLDGQSWSAILIDKNGEVLFDNPIWMDTRASEICGEIRETVGEKNIFDLCGNPFAPTYTTPKIIWFKRNYPDIFKKTYKVMQSNSYIVYKLTGVLSQDLSQCYGLHFYDMRKQMWDKNMADAMGIDVNLMPEIYNCHDIVGGITREAAALTGLSEGTPVVAGGLDAACGTLGAGVITDGETQGMGGQSGGMSICCDEYKSHEKLILCNHVVPGKYLLQGGTIGAGASFKWLRENFFSDMQFSEMDEMAKKIPCGSDGVIFLPYMAGERSPIWDPKAKGVFYGFDFSKNKAHFIRSVMEGVAYSLQHNIETAAETGSNIRTLYITGGLANSDLWMQIKSDVTNKPVAVPLSDTAGTLGAAILAGIAVGIYSDFADAVKNTVTIRKTYYPNPENHELYMKRYSTYRGIYEKLKEIMGK